MPKKRAVTLANLGASLFKCAPDTWDLARFLADGEREIDNWSVRESYRLDLFAPEQRPFFRASEGHDGVEAGIVGDGAVTGRFFDGTGGEYGIDDREAAQQRTVAELELTLLGTRLPRDVFLADPVLRGADVFRQPFSSNPSFLTMRELEVVDRLLAAGNRRGRS
jgi:hypothetical protein